MIEHRKEGESKDAKMAEIIDAINVLSERVARLSPKLAQIPPRMSIDTRRPEWSESFTKPEEEVKAGTHTFYSKGFCLVKMERGSQLFPCTQEHEGVPLPYAEDIHERPDTRSPDADPAPGRAGMGGDT